MKATLLGQRRNDNLLKLPPYLSALCIIVGVVWLLLLPLNEYSRQTYVSENALLPGQVHTYFGGSEHNIFRAYRHEVAALADKSREERTEKLTELLRGAGVKVATQKYSYAASGRNISNENVYAVLQGPRADATEAIVLIASWTTMDGREINHSGVALLLTLARYFNRWSLWSKDIIFLISGDPTTGPQAWVDAYHDYHSPGFVEPLSIKSGALQGAVAMEYPAGPWGHRFDKLHILYDGVNGQLSNLDLFNTAVQIASGQMGIGCTLQRMWKHDDSYEERLQTMLRGMISQGLGHASGPHSSFIPYHVDAITLQTVGDGWHDEMSLGRTVESLFRSLNNLLEHLHQSFFLYLLMQANRFVSVGTYLPSAMLIAANFTITSIALWVLSGRPETKPNPNQVGESKEKTKQSPKDAVASSEVVERSLFLPLAFVIGVHFLGLLPLYIFNNSSETVRISSFNSQPSTNNSPEHACRLLRRNKCDNIPPTCCCHSPGSHPPSDQPRSNPHPMLLPPPSRHVPRRPRNSQLLPLFPHRSFICSAQLCARKHKETSYQCGSQPSARRSKPSGCDVRRCKVLWR